MTEEILNAERKFDEYFPKGNKDRGKVLAIYACLKLESQEAERERILKIIDNFVKKKRFYYKQKRLFEELKSEITEDEN